MIEKVEEIKKNIKTWGCGTSRFQVMALGKRGHKFLFSRNRTNILSKTFIQYCSHN